MFFFLHINHVCEIVVNLSFQKMSPSPQESQCLVKMVSHKEESTNIDNTKNLRNLKEKEHLLY